MALLAFVFCPCGLSAGQAILTDGLHLLKAQVDSELTAASQEQSGLRKAALTVTIVCAVLCALIVAFMLWSAQQHSKQDEQRLYKAMCVRACVLMCVRACVFCMYMRVVCVRVCSLCRRCACV